MKHRIQLTIESMHDLCEHSLDGMLTTLPSGEVLDGNPAACVILGCEREELRGKTRLDFVDNTDPRLVTYLSHRAQFGWAMSQLRMRTFDGLCFEAEVSSSVITTVAEDVYYWVTFRKLDVPLAVDDLQLPSPHALEAKVRDRIQVLEAANSDLQAFSSGVSHDLRGPVAVVEAFSTVLLEQGSLGPRHLAHVTRIHAAAGHMKEMIESLLSLALVDRTSLKLQRVDVERMAFELSSECEALYLQKLEVSLDCPAPARADSGLLRCIMRNLLANAYKFTGNVPSPRVDVSCHQVPGGWTRIAVRDNGAGFDGEYAKSLFQPFRRLHSQSEFPGLGIGLATVYRIVQKHGGLVRASGTPGVGATFEVFLPDERETQSARPNHQARPRSAVDCWCADCTSTTDFSELGTVLGVLP